MNRPGCSLLKSPLPEFPKGVFAPVNDLPGRAVQTTPIPDERRIGNEAVCMDFDIEFSADSYWGREKLCPNQERNDIFRNPLLLKYAESLPA
jgi:hypothetical protein